VAEAAVVLGGSGGIGAACVRRLAGAYDAVLAVSRRSPAEELLALDGVSWVEADIGAEAGRGAVLTALATADAALGALVVASGVAHRGPLETQTREEWERTLAVNLVGPALLLSALLAGAAWANPAGVVLVGSLSARRALPDRALYGASKAALEHFGRCAAVELAPRGISVNTVSVGVTDTPFLSGDRERIAAYARERIPAGRMAEPDEVAEAVAFALAPIGSLTGSTIDLDGGAGVLG
jgi:NAD(P)-dependent dehydrogenase (short-subunit alcohol dehydrogenase family)